MKRLFLLILGVMLTVGTAKAIDLLDATKPKDSDLISTYGAKERETRGRVNEILSAFPNCTNGTIEPNTYYPELYGAACDNVTDDTAAFVATIAAAPVGSKIKVPNKPCVANIEVDKILAIEGSWGRWDNSATFYGIRPYDPNKPVIKVTHATNLVPVNIKDLFILGNSSDSTVGIQFAEGSRGCRVDNVTVKGFVDSQILIGDDNTDLTNPITDINISNSYITAGNIRGNGIKLKTGPTGTGASNWITGVHVDRTYFTPNATLLSRKWILSEAHTAGSAVTTTDDSTQGFDSSAWGWIFVADTDCVSDATEPTWHLGDGNTTTDGTCTWTTRQRGRAIWLEGAGVTISDSYIDALHFGGIRWQRATSLVDVSNVQLDANGLSAVVMENAIDNLGLLYISGSLYSSTGYYKAVGTTPFKPKGDIYGGYVNSYQAPLIMGAKSSLGMFFVPTSNLYYGSDPYDNLVGRIQSSDMATFFSVSSYKNAVPLYLNDVVGSGNIFFGDPLGGKWNKPHPQWGNVHMWHDNSTSPGNMMWYNSTPINATTGYKFMSLDALGAYPTDLTIDGRLQLYSDDEVNTHPAYGGYASSLVLIPRYHGDNSTIYHYYIPLTEPQITDGNATIGGSFLFSEAEAPGAGTLIEAAAGGATGWIRNFFGGSTRYIPIFDAKDLFGGEMTINGTGVHIDDNLTIDGSPAVTGPVSPTAGNLAKWGPSGDALVDGPAATNVPLLDGNWTHTGTKIGLFSATPVTQQTALTTKDAKIVTESDNATIVINNLRTRLNELETKLQNYGLLQ